MGRPLKIAKAQAVITITNTTTGTNLVTTSANFTTLGIIAGMPFVAATTINNITAGTLYWILSVANAGDNSTFTVSETPLNANPTSTPLTLGNASGTVVTTVAPVDMYFNNPNGPEWPATNANTYSVVGGNTALYGKQVLANISIAQNGTGTIYAASANANIFGVGTDFTNTLSAGSYVASVGSDGTITQLGFVSGAVAGYANIELSNATATGNFLTSVGDATTLFASQPVVLSANIGGLTAGTTYFVKTIANTTAFSVSLTAGGANVPLSSENATSYALQDRVVLAAGSTATVTNSAFQFATAEAGYIVRQKGKQKYLVTGTTSGLTGACYTANVANTALTPGTMTITATYANSATVKVQSLSDHTAELFTATSGGPATETDNINNAAPAFATFNTALAANATQYGDFSYGNAQPYPIVTIGNA